MTAIRVVGATRGAHLWPEFVFLYIKYDEFVCFSLLWSYESTTRVMLY
jgi:hypothetical protein